VANAAGFIHESIWRNEDWRQLSRGAQALYMQLLSQKELDCAGILPLQPNKWAKGCVGLTVEQVMTDLEELQAHRFVFFDTDTDEAFVRTYMRNSNVVKVPNMRKAASRAALLVGSESIRPLLAAELRVMGDAGCVSAADQIDPSGTVTETVPPTVPEPSRNGSKITLPEPLPEPTGVGKGVGVTHLGNYSRGGATPPPEFCPKHPQGTDAPCRACGGARQRREAWEAEHAGEAQTARNRARAAALQVLAECRDCDEHGWLLDADGVPAEPAVKCSHVRQAVSTDA
jgi:hypothetical protein